MHDPLPWRGTRIALRRLRPGDLASFQAYRHDAEVGRYQGWEAQPDAEARAFIAEMARAPFGRPGEWLQIAIADAATDELLGRLLERLGMTLEAEVAADFRGEPCRERQYAMTL